MDIFAAPTFPTQQNNRPHYVRSSVRQAGVVDLGWGLSGRDDIHARARGGSIDSEPSTSGTSDGKELIRNPRNE